MNKLKSESITAIHPKSWPTWAFVSVDNDTYTDSEWSGCDYRVNEENMPSHNLAVDIFITGRKSFWNGFTFETKALIVFPKDGDIEDVETRGIVYSTEPLKSN
jgi:hypothetical protein